MGRRYSAAPTSVRSLLIVVLAATGVILVATLAGPATSRSPRPVVGNAHDNRLVGTDGADRIAGRGGADRIAGRDGADVLEGGPGFDRLHGGPGADTILGGGGGAAMVGGLGRDQFNAVAGEPIGGRGRDVIRARDGHRDVVNCGPGRDVARVDRVEDGVFGCERIVQPSSGQKRGEG